MVSDKSLDKHFVHTYARSGAPMVRGKGTWLYDETGVKYLDFGSGIAVTALGHSHPKIVAALKKQGSMLIHASNLYYMAPQIELAKQLTTHSFGKKVFFCNSGTEAIEAAIKFARKTAALTDKKRYHVLSFSDCFHGRTYGALSATSQKKFHQGFGPLVPGFHYAPFNDIEAAKRMLDKHAFAAVIVEPVQGEGGVNVADKAFLKFLRDYTAHRGIALIADEIQCGLGRAGKLWGYQIAGVKPDIMVLAKPLGGGLPLGAVVCTNAIAASIAPGDHGTTFGGNPLACALGRVALETVANKDFLKAVREKGAYMAQKLESVCVSAGISCHMRGVGLMRGVRFEEDPAALIAACRDKGLLVIKAGHNTVRFMPPLTVSKAEINNAAKIFAEALAR
jgi:acetylornithine/N-succinyldiaminopimelate aminotransferase